MRTLPAFFIQKVSGFNCHRSCLNCICKILRFNSDISKKHGNQIRVFQPRATTLPPTPADRPDDPMVDFPAFLCGQVDSIPESVKLTQAAIGSLPMSMQPCTVKPALHQPQLQVEWSVTLVSSIVIERRCCTLKSAASLDCNRIK